MKTKEQMKELCLNFAVEKHTLTASRVFSVLLGVLKFDEDIYFNRNEISEMLGIHVSGMSLAIKEIVDSGFITQTKKVGPSKFYRLNLPRNSLYFFHWKEVTFFDGDISWNGSAVKLDDNERETL